MPTPVTAPPLERRLVGYAALLAALNTAAAWQIATTLDVAVPTLALFLRGAVTFVGALLLVAAGRSNRSLALALPAAALIVIGDIVAYRMSPTGPALTAGPWTLLLAFLALRWARPVTADRLLAWWIVLSIVGLVLSAATLLPGIGQATRGQNLVSPLGGNTAELGRLIVLAGLALGVARVAPTRSAAANAAPLIPVLILCLLQVLGNDHSPLALIVAAVGIAYALRFGRLRLLAVAGGVLLLLAAAVFAVNDDLLVRANAALLPVDAANPGRETTQLGSAMLAMAWGGLGGTGLGGGLVLGPGAPADQATDFALVVFTQESGLLGMALVLAGWTAILGWGWVRISRTTSPVSMLTAGTIWGAISVQLLLVSAGVLSLLPHAGLTMPFVSGGMSSRIAVCFALLVVVSLTRPQPQLTASGLPVANDRPPSPWSAPWRMGALVVGAMLLILVGAGLRIDGLADQVNDRAGNPWFEASGLRRGAMLTSADGSVVQRTTGAASLDTVRRLHVGPGNATDHAVRAITGPTLGRADVPGLARTLADVMRCGGRGSVRVTPAATIATAADGDPRACQPAGVSISLDRALVGAADSALRGRAGAVVVTEAASGRVLALAGRAPGRPDEPTPQLALHAAVAPGSTFKAAIGLLVPPDARAPWAATYRASDGTPVPGSTCGGTLGEAITASCNSAFARWAEQAGAARLRRLGHAIGLDRPRAIAGLPIIAGGVFADAPPSPGHVAAAGIGQGQVTATPIDVATIGAAVASDGVVHAPRMVDAVCRDDGRGVLVSAVPDRGTRVASATAARAVLDAMRGPLGASLAPLAPGGTFVAGKTGTAEVPARRDLGTPLGNVAWTLAVTRPTDPGGSALVVVAMLLPTPSDPAPQGARDAAPVVARMRSAIERHLRREPRQLCEAANTAA